MHSATCQQRKDISHLSWKCATNHVQKFNKKMNELNLYIETLERETVTVIQLIGFACNFQLTLMTNTVNTPQSLLFCWIGHNLRMGLHHGMVIWRYLSLSYRLKVFH